MASLASRLDAVVAADADEALNVKLILTGDLFNTKSTMQPLKETLRSFLGHRSNLRALWIHDARAGWHPIAVARGWMMDGFGELEHLADCGIAKSSGLWIDRWRSTAAGADPPPPMLLCETLSKTYSQSYKPADLDAVTAALDEASLLYLPGGNPYTLLEALRSEVGSRVWARAKARIDSGDLVVLTRSAGTIVAGATIDVSTERPDGWTGDPTGLCLAPAPLAFVPHFHLPQQQWIRHSKEWRQATAKGMWCKEDFLAALDAEFRAAEWRRLAQKAVLPSSSKRSGKNLMRVAAAASAERAEVEARRRQIRGVPLREGSFVAFNGATVTCHEGPEPEALPSWLAARVRQYEGAFWALMWSVTELNMSLEEYTNRPQAERSAELLFVLKSAVALPCLAVLLVTRTWVAFVHGSIASPLSLKPVQAEVSAPSLGMRAEVCVHMPWSVLLIFALPPLLALLVLRGLIALLRAKYEAFLSAWSCPRKPKEVHARAELATLGIVHLDVRATLATAKPKLD